MLFLWEKLVIYHPILHSIPTIDYFEFFFLHEDIGKIIQNLNQNKSHGHHNISVRKLKMCSSSIYGPLELIFKEGLSTGFFPSDWKKGNIAPMHKNLIDKFEKLPSSVINLNMWKNL